MHHEAQKLIMTGLPRKSRRLTVRPLESLSVKLGAVRPTVNPSGGSVGVQVGGAGVAVGVQVGGTGVAVGVRVGGRGVTVGGNVDVDGTRSVGRGVTLGMNVGELGTVVGIFVGTIVVGTGFKPAVWAGVVLAATASIKRISVQASNTIAPTIPNAQMGIPLSPVPAGILCA